jgi:hypothetical protein
MLIAHAPAHQRAAAADQLAIHDSTLSPAGIGACTVRSGRAWKSGQTGGLPADRPYAALL